ncbi:MAG: hypothetical protein FWH55_11575 [Oscillospiraceae bacterium]|nr:hypothetical protein [Oscillospiraceae bacterium]
MENDATPKSSLSKKKIILIVVCVCALAVAGLAALMLRKPSASDAERFSSEYLLIDEDNIFVYKNAKQTIDILTSGTGIVFLGYPACPWCQAYVVLLQDAAKQMGVKEIFYLDISNDRSNNSIEYQRLVEMKEHHLLLDDNGNPRIFVPDVTVVKDGVMVGHDNETCTMSDMDPSDYWTLSKVDALQERLRGMIKLIQ